MFVCFRKALVTLFNGPQKPKLMLSLYDGLLPEFEHQTHLHSACIKLGKIAIPTGGSRDRPVA